jgi:hypothetical protein
MARQDYDLSLTRYANEGWRATFNVADKEHSPTASTARRARRHCGARCRRPAWDGARPLMIALLRTSFVALLFLALGVTACAMSEEARCKKGGGVWRGTYCETPAR